VCDEWPDVEEKSPARRRAQRLFAFDHVLPGVRMPSVALVFAGQLSLYI